MTATTTATSTTSAAPTDPNRKSSTSSPPKPKPSTVKPNPNRNNSQNAQQKKIPGKSKPIINWFQRKLAGTVKAKRVVDVPQNVRRAPSALGGGARPTNRITSSPLPSAAPTHVNRQQGRFETMTDARRKTISLNGDDVGDDGSLSDRECSDDESAALGSTWSPRSVLEADEDASMRPLPPSSPPSPSPSRSSSSYLSDPRTFKSVAASTKPTTLLSIDLHGNGMAHIAEAPITPNSQSRFPHMRTSSTSTTPNVLSSGASITFAALPPSPQSSRPSSTATAPQQGPVNSVQAPLHTTHHPRNNPRPSSPPMDNASMLTLASSAYAFPGLRVGGLGTPVGWGSSPPSAVVGGADSVSQFEADVESQNDVDEEPLDDRDVDASLRALRPRSTRRGSWESEVSRWSARIQVGAPSLARDRSVWTGNSIRTGTEQVDVYEKSDETGEVTNKADEEVDTDEPSTTAAEDELSSPTTPSEAVVDVTNVEEQPAPARDESPSVEQPLHPVFEETTSSDTVAQVAKSEAENDKVPVEAGAEVPGADSLPTITTPSEEPLAS